jgi:hypothetical protein
LGFLGEEAGRTGGLPDQTGPVASEPDLAVRPDERIKLAVGMTPRAPQGKSQSIIGIDQMV